jgi:hypothetical protein
LLADLVARLDEVLGDRGSPRFVEHFEETVEQIAHIDDPSSIEALLGFVDDGLDDDLVFSIVHTVERFDDDTYLTHLVAALPGLAARSPEWARTLVLRVLNSPGTLVVLRERVPRLSGPPAAALRATLRELAADAQFAGRAEDLLDRWHGTGRGDGAEAGSNT